MLKNYPWLVEYTFQPNISDPGMNISMRVQGQPCLNCKTKNTLAYKISKTSTLTRKTYTLLCGIISRKHENCSYLHLHKNERNLR